METEIWKLALASCPSAAIIAYLVKIGLGFLREESKDQNCRNERFATSLDRLSDIIVRRDEQMNRLASGGTK